MYSKYLTLYLALALSAATALMYEVVASNILFYYFAESTFSVSTVLSTFLVGLALGSFLYYRFQATIPDKRTLFALLQLLIAGYGLVVFAHITEIVPQIDTLGIFIVSVLILLVPTIALGVVFPLTLTLVEDTSKSGLVYFIDLLGAAAGSLIAGFYLIPVLGNTLTVYVAVCLSVCAAALMFKGLMRGVTGLLLLAVGVYVFYTLPQPHAEDTDTAYEYFKKASPYGEIIVDNRTLYIDSRDQCAWDYPDTATEREVVEKTFEHISTPDAKVLNIGLGCGLTLSRLLSKTTEQVDIVEINPVVVEANERQSTLLKNPRVNLTVMDGILYLRDTDKRYDAIVVDIDNPAVVYSSNLYTVETFTAAREALLENGVFGLWINRCDSGEYNDVMYNTLKRAFTHVHQINENIFIASESPLPYAPYVPFTEAKGVNTIDSKPLAKLYYDACRFGKESEHYLKF